MRATLSLDDEPGEKAQRLSGVTARTALLREALKAMVPMEASRRLAALGGSEDQRKNRRKHRRKQRRKQRR